MGTKYRKRILYAALGLLIAAAGVAGFVQHQGARRLAAATERFELDVGALDPAVHAPPDLPDSENAAHRLQQGSAALTLSDADRAALGDFWKHDEKVPKPAVVDLLERNARAIEHFRRAGELTRSSWGVPYAAGPEAMPDLLGQLVAMKVLLADARVGLAGGDRPRVLAGGRALAAMRRALEREPAFLFQLVATAVQPAHHRLIQDLLMGDPADAALLEESASQLDAAAERSLRSAIAVEASWLVGGLDDLASEERKTLSERLRRVPERLWVPWETAAGLDLYHRLALASELPATQITDFMQSRPSSAPIIGIIAEMLIPNLIDGVEKHRAGDAARRLAGLAVELRLHALRHGAYPEDLGGFPAAAAPDPYADGDIRYEVRPDGTAELSFPDAESLWREKYPHGSHHGTRLAWTLPAA